MTSSNVSEFSVGLAHEFTITAAKAGFTPEQFGELANNEEKMNRIKRFVDNDCRLIVKGPSTLTVDRSKPFDPATFIRRDWTIEEQDQRALLLTEIDFSKAVFESGVAEGEDYITGEQKLERLKARPEIRLDAAAGKALFEEEGQMTLRFLYKTQGITWLELAGTILRLPVGGRSFLYLYRSVDGSWHWSYYWLGNDRDRGSVSPLLAS